MKTIFDMMQKNSLDIAYKIVFSIYLALFSLTANSQTHTLADSSLVLELNNKAREFYQTDIDSSIFYSEKALAISQEIDYQRGIAKSWTAIGYMYSQKGEIAKGKKYIEQSIILSEKEHFLKEKALANNNLAIIYNREGDYEKGLEIGKRNLEIYTKLNDSAGIAMCCTNIAKSLSFMNFFDEGRNYLFKSLALYKALGKTDKIAHRYSDIGESYLAQTQIQEAKKYLFQSLSYCKASKNPEIGYEPMFNLALCYEHEEKDDSAAYYYQKCVNLGRNSKAEAQLEYAWCGLGSVALKAGKLSEATQYLQQGLAIAETYHNTQVIRDASISLAEAYEKLGDYKRAFAFQQKGYIAKDSLLNEDKIKAIAKLNSQLEIAEVTRKNEYLQKENEIQKLRLFRKNIVIFAVLGIMLFLIALGMMLLRHNRMKARHQHLELEQKQLRAQMNPHFIFNCLNSIQHYMVYNDIKNANKYLTEFASLMRKTLDILGNDSISLQQEKDYLDNYLLLEQMRFEHQFEYEIAIDKTIDIQQVEIPPMIIQPFAENAIRHGFQYLDDKHHGKLSISFQQKGNDIVCTIDDNGIGRKKAEAIKSKLGQGHQSFGIDLTKQRLDLMNKIKHTHYDLQLIDKQSAEGLALGTQIIIKIPK